MDVRDYEQVALGARVENAAVRRAIQYITDRSWCKTLVRVFVALEHADKFVILLAEVNPSTDSAPKWNWVISGDVPAAYIPGPEAENEYDALNVYLGEMKAWAEAVRGGEPLDAVFPIDAPATLENAAALERRVAYLADKVLTPNRDRLSKRPQA